MTNKNKFKFDNPEINFLANVNERIGQVDGGDYDGRLVEALLNEEPETPEEIAELEAIPEERKEENN